MAELQRITGKLFGETADPTDDLILGPQIGQFGSALAGTYNGTADVATIQSLPAWSQGFIGAVTPNNQYPPLPEVTGVLKVLSHQENYILQHGVPEWDSATDYYTNCYCSYNGEIYKSLQDNNTNNQPDTSPTYWTLYGDFANKNLSNLTNVGNAKLQYAPFAINTGSTSSGKNNTLTYSGADITCAPCTITTADGRTTSFDSSATYSITTEGDGDYYIFKDFSTGALSLVREYEFAISNTKGIKNVARQPVTTSNFVTNAQYAFDGNWNSYAATGTSITIANNAYIGQSAVQKPVKRIRFNQGLTNVNYCPSYRLQYSTDNGSTWNTIQTQSNGVTNAWQTVTVSDYVPNGSHRFRVLAVSFAGTQGTNQWVVTELELYCYTNYWLDTSKSPAVMRVYNSGTDTYTTNNDLVCIGECTITSSNVTAITNYLFNDNGYSDGTATEARFTMPSSTNYSYTIGASGSYYKAVANGWITVGTPISATNAIVQLVGNTGVGETSNYSTYGGDGYGARAQIPVKKGDMFYLRYSQTPSFMNLIYADGSEREA